jgi:hypothetical protein
MRNTTKITSLILIFALFGLITLITPASIQAEYETMQQGIDASGDKVVQNLTKFVGEDLNSIAIQGGGGLMGSRTSTGEIVHTGVVPVIGQTMVAMIINPPVSSGEYIADILHNSGLAKQAYAQGIGFAGLSPVLEIWKAFRNLAYFLFIIMFVVIGFMIMFRTKISQNAVVTIQEALPRIVVSLILITFSYAIAGFVIDMIYLSIFIITSLFETFGIFNEGGGLTARNLIFGKNIIALGFSLFVGPSGVAGESAAAVTSILSEAFGNWGNVISFITTPFAYLIIAVAIVIALFRTFFTLISAYIGIIVSTIFAPIQLLLHAYPGNDSFGKWFQGLIANAAVFPTAAVMIFLGAALVGGNSPARNNTVIFPIQNNIGWGNTSNTASGWVPPLIASGDASQAGPAAIRAIIGLGMIMLLPEVIKLVHEALQYKTPWYGEASTKNIRSGDFFSGGTKLIVGTGMQIGTQYASSHIGEWVTRYKATRNKNKQVAAQQAVAQSHQQQPANPILRNRPLSPKKNLSPSTNPKIG